MSEHLAAAAAALNAPETIVARSAEARAKATGASIDDILAAWAGGGSAPPAPTPTPAPAPAAQTPPEPAPQATEAPAATPAPPAETPATQPAAAVVSPLPGPTTVSPEEALRHPVVVSVPTAGLKERTGGALPRWLAAAFMIIPVFGLLYLSSNLQTDGCTEGGFELSVDRATGVVENCDGSAFEGRGGVGGPGAAFLVEGREIYANDGCAGCHGANGEGGTGPAFANVLLTFGACADHQEWVLKGSAGFQAEGRTTYGDIAKPIAGGMPPHAGLSAEQLASVVAFERAVFGGGNAEEVLIDCGLVAAPDGGAPAEGDAPAEVPAEGEARVGSTG